MSANDVASSAIDASDAPGIWQTSAGILGLSLLLGFMEAGQIYIGSAYTGRAMTWGKAVVSTLPSWIVLAGLAPGILWLARRFPLDRSAWRVSVPVHTAAAVAFAMLHLGGTSAADMLRGHIQPPGFVLEFWYLLRVYFVLDVLTYWAIVGGFHALRYYRGYQARELAASRLQASLTEARLQALHSQLHPHFLFNTLNAISVLALKGERDAVVEMLGRLSELLRASLDDDRRQEVPLATELKFLEQYLDIQRIRFADRLIVREQVAPEALEALVPSMILQPLVENAVRHGIAAQTGPGRIEIHVSRDNGSLRLQVRDTGPGFNGRGGRPPEGIGLANTRARLEQLYGAAQRFEYGDASEGGAAVTITMPFRRQDPPAPAAELEAS